MLDGKVGQCRAIIHRDSLESGWETRVLALHFSWASNPVGASPMGLSDRLPAEAGRIIHLPHAQQQDDFHLHPQREWLQVRLYMVTQLEVKFGVFRHDSTSAPCTQPVIPPGATAVIEILLQESPQAAAVLVADDSLRARRQPPARRPPAIAEIAVLGRQPTETSVAPADGEVGGPLHGKV
jgi:hypothetical protein